MTSQKMKREPAAYRMDESGASDVEILAFTDMHGIRFACRKRGWM